LGPTTWKASDGFLIEADLAQNFGWTTVQSTADPRFQTICNAKILKISGAS
jgi:hypothetical protein